MSRLNDPENFGGRVAYAAKIIAYGRSPSRAFDNCFENNDGDEVAAAIVRRARKNPKIAANLDNYLNRQSAEKAAERLADIPTRQLPVVARETRARKEVEFRERLAERNARENTKTDEHRASAPIEGRES